MSRKLMERGDKAFEMQDFRKAAKFFRRIIEADKDNLQALQKLAVCYCFMGKADLGIICFNSALELNPDNETKLEILSNMANAYMFKGQETGDHEYYDKSIEINRKILGDIEGKEGVYLNLGNLYKYKEEFEKSIATFKDALKKYPNNARLMTHLANAIRAKDMGSDKAPIEVINLYKEAKKIDPNYIGAYMNLGCVYHEYGMDELSLKEFRSAYSINPDDPKLLEVMEQLGIEL